MTIREMEIEMEVINKTLLELTYDIDRLNYMIKMEKKQKLEKRYDEAKDCFTKKSYKIRMARKFIKDLVGEEDE